MDDPQKQQAIQKALEFWENGQPFRAAGTIFKCIPLNKRHLWVFNVLNFVYSVYPINIDVEAVLANPSFIILDKPIICHPGCPTYLTIYPKIPL